MPPAPKPTVELKNGTVIDAEIAQECLSSLRNLLEDKPKSFQLLFRIAQGAAVDQKKIRNKFGICYHMFFEEDGRIAADIKNVLLSAYQETREGPVLVNPFKFADVHEVNDFEAADDARSTSFKNKFWERVRREEEDRGPKP